MPEASSFDQLWDSLHSQPSSFTTTAEPPPDNGFNQLWDNLRAGQLSQPTIQAPPDLSGFGEALSQTAAVRTSKVETPLRIQWEPKEYLPDEVQVENKPRFTKEVHPLRAPAEMIGMTSLGDSQTMADAWDAIKGTASYINKIIQQPQAKTSLAEEVGTPTRKPTATEEVLTGAQQAGVGVGKTLAEPENVALLGTGVMPKLAQKLVSAYYFQQMLRDTAPLAQEAGEALASGDKRREAKALGDLLVNVGFVLTTGKHAATPGHITEWKAQEEGLNQWAQAKANEIVDHDPLEVRQEVYRGIAPSLPTQENIPSPEQKSEAQPKEAPNELRTPEQKYKFEIERTVSGEKPLVLLGYPAEEKLKSVGLQTIRTPRKDGNLDLVIGFRPENRDRAEQLRQALIAGDDRNIGLLLGYPPAEVEDYVASIQPKEQPNFVRLSDLQGQVGDTATPEEITAIQQPAVDAERERQVAAAEARPERDLGPSYEQWAAQQDLEQQRQAGQAGPLSQGRGAESLGVPLQRPIEITPAEEAGQPGPLQRGEMAKELGVPLSRTRVGQRPSEMARKIQERSRSQPQERQLPQGPLSQGKGAESLGVPLTRELPAPTERGLIAGTKLEAWADDKIRNAGKTTNIAAQPELAAAGVIKGAALLERGVREFGTWSKTMIRQFGELSRDTLVDLWNKSHDRLQWLRYQPDYVPQYRLDVNPDESWRVLKHLDDRLLEEVNSGVDHDTARQNVMRDELKRQGFSGYENQSSSTWKNSRAKVYAKDSGLGNLIDMQLRYVGPESKLLPEGVTLQSVPDFAKRYDPETLFQRPAWVQPGSALDKILGRLREQLDPFKGEDVTGIWKALTPKQRQELVARGWNPLPSRIPNQVILHVANDAVPAKKFYDMQNRKRSQSEINWQKPDGISWRDWLKQQHPINWDTTLNDVFEKQSVADQNAAASGVNRRVVPGDVMLKAIMARSNGWQNMLAQRLYDAGIFVPVEHAPLQTAWGDYTRFEDGRELIRLNSEMAHNQIETLLHEFVHAATQGALEKNADYAAEMQKLMEWTREHVKDPENHVSLNDLSEFVTDAFSKPHFQGILDKLFIKEGPFRTAWQALVNLVRRIIGLPENTNSVLERVIKQSTKQFGETPPQLRPIELKSEIRDPKRAEEIFEALEADKPGEGRDYTIGQAAGEPLAHLDHVKNTIFHLQSLANAKLPATATPEERQARDTARAVLNDPIVKHHIANVVEGAEWAAKKLGGKLVDWQTYRDDPNVTLDMKAKSTFEAYESFKDFDDTYSRAVTDLPQKRAELEKQLEQVMKGRDYNKTQTQVHDRLWDDLVDAGREIITASGDARALAVYENFVRRAAVGQRIMEWMGKNVDWHTVVNGVAKTTDDFMALVERAAKDQKPDDPVRQTVGGSDEDIRYVASLIMRSEPLRQRLFEGSELLKDKALNYPIKSFMSEIAKLVKDGKYQQALRVMTQGIGDTAIKADTSRKAAAFFARKERQTITELAAIDEVQQFLEQIRTSPYYIETRRNVFAKTGSGLDVKREIIGWNEDGKHYTALPIRRFGPDGTTENKPYFLSFDSSKEAVEKYYSEWRRFKAEALDYIAHPEDPEYREEKANALRQFLDRYAWYDDVTLNPTVGKVMPGLGLQIQNHLGSLLGSIDEIPSFVGLYGAGPVANFFNQSLQIYSTAKEVGYQAWVNHNSAKNHALAEALKAHGNMSVADYQDLIYKPLVASRQYYENPGKLEVGSPTGTGHEILAVDMEVLKRDKAYQNDVLQRYTGQNEKAWSLLRDNPAAVLTEQNGPFYRVYRRPVPTGPDTMPRYDDTAVRLAGDWSKLDETGRVKLLNQYLQTITLGYVRGVREFTFKFDYKFKPELSEIEHETRAGQTLGSFDDLIERITEKYNARMGGEGKEGLTNADVRKEVLAQFDNIFAKGATSSGIKGPKSATNIMGGSNPLNTPRGEQIFPSLWYDYGTLTTSEAVGFYADGATQFFIAHYNAAKALEKSLRDIVARFDDEGRAGLTRGISVKDQRMGRDYYNWNEARRAHGIIKNYVEHLGQIEKGYGDVNWANTWLRGTGIGGVLPPFLLTGPGAYGLNRAGGIMAAALNDRVMRGATPAISTGKQLAMVIPDLLLKAVSHRDNPAYILTKWSGGKPLIGGIANVIGQWMDNTRQRRIDAKDDGLVAMAGLKDQITAMFDFAGSGGVVTRNGISPGAFSKIAGGVATTARATGNVAGRVGVQFVDRWINEKVRPDAEAKMEELEKRIRDYMPLHEERARQEGRQIFNVRGKADLTDLANVLSNDELAKRPGLNKAEVDLLAVRMRDFWRQKMGLSLDDLAWDYWKRFSEAKRDGKPTEGIRLLDDAQMRQFVLTEAENINLPTFASRPTGPLRWGKLGRVGYTFFGYPIWYSSELLHGLTSYLSTQSMPNRVRAMLPAIVAVTLTAAILGSLVTVGVDDVKQMMGRYGPVPTLQDALAAGNPKAVVNAALDGWANMTPGVGTLYEMLLSGNAYKRGFDVNQQLVYLNFANDAIKTFREAAQSGDASLPFLRFSQRWSGLLGYGIGAMPSVRGLRDLSSTRNILTRGAKVNGFEANLKEPGAGNFKATPATPYINRYANAVANGQADEIQTRHDDLVNYYVGTGLTKDEASKRALRDLSSRNPITGVFGGKPTQQQFDTMLAGMPAREQDMVRRVLHNFDSANKLLGKNVAFTKEQSVANRSTRPKKPTVLKTRGQRVLGRIRRLGGSSGLARVRRLIGRPTTQPKKRTRITA